MPYCFSIFTEFSLKFAVIPVDLNSILYMNEMTLARFHAMFGNTQKAAFYQKQAQQRKQAVQVRGRNPHYNNNMELFRLSFGTRKNFSGTILLLMKEKAIITSILPTMCHCLLTVTTWTIPHCK